MDLTEFLKPEEIERARAFAVRPPEDLRLRRADLATNAWAQVLRAGPKLFDLPEGVLRSLWGVTIPIPFGDFRTPYDEMIVRFPGWFSGVIINTPETLTVMMSGHASDRRWSFHGLHHPHEGEGKTGTIQEVIDADLDAFTGPIADTEVNTARKRMMQLFLNAALLLGHLGVVRRGWADPKARARHERAGRFLERDLEVYETRQSVSLWARENLAPVDRAAGGGGWSVRPHWRQGHWWMKPHGPGRSERTLAFRKAVFVNRDVFKGEMADTQVTYQ